jgi:hypothetical protein
MYGFILFQSPEFDLDGLVIEDPVEDLSSNGHAPYVPYDSDKDHKDIKMHAILENLIKYLISILLKICLYFEQVKLFLCKYISI